MVFICNCRYRTDFVWTLKKRDRRNFKKRGFALLKLHRNSMRRFLVQFFAFIGTNSYFTQNTTKAYCVPTLNCYSCPLASFACPLGTVQHFVTLHSVPWFVIGFMSTIGAVVGRMTCGWLCPFGWFQDLLYKIKTVKFGLPSWFGYTKFLNLLILAIIMPYFTLETWFCKLCPQGILEAGIPWIFIDPSLQRLLGWLFTLKFLILGTVIILSVFTKRPFCKMCPIGAFLGLFNYVSLFKLRVNIAECNKCDNCYRVCPVGIKPYQTPNSHECIRCMECIYVCDLISYTTLLKPKNIPELGISKG